MGAEETCRLAAELEEEFGERSCRIAERAIATFEAEGRADRAQLWRVLHAILADISARRFDPYGRIAIH